MSVDWQASKEAWVAAVLARLVPILSSDHRFPSSTSVIDRFKQSVERWRKGGDIRQLINDANELAAAAALLNILKLDDVLSYEPRLSATPKTIDFRVESKDGSRGWVDMKTVAPVWDDDETAWQRFANVASDFPSNVNLIVNRDSCGAAIGGQMVNTRRSFVQRTIEVETKAALLTAQERGPVWLLFCSAGEWRKDDLEDFADFYRTGKFREDDWSRNEVAQYMAKKGLSFSRSLAGFCYLERRHDAVEASGLEFDVRGPTMFGPAA